MPNLAVAVNDSFVLNAFFRVSSLTVSSQVNNSYINIDRTASNLQIFRFNQFKFVPS